MTAECKPGGLLDLAIADVMGFTQKQMAEMFNTTRGAISKRITARNPEMYEELKGIILRESAKEAAKLIARQSFDRVAERIDLIDDKSDDNDD